jgi:hypothetical protein
MRLRWFGLLLLTSCASTNPYRDTWQPLSLAVDRAASRVVDVALLVDQPSDEQAIAAAGGTLIGHHAAQSDWALRAGSTGGTHFMPVRSATRRVHARCDQDRDPGRCQAAERRGNWSKIAVYRVSPERWHLLPPHLVPPEQTVRVRASAVREGCAVDKVLGTTKCRADWEIDT